jgi:hypothetical protein
MPRKSVRLTPKNRKRTTRKSKGGKSNFPSVFTTVLIFSISALFLSGYLLYKLVLVNFAAADDGFTGYRDRKPIPTLAYIVVNDLHSNSLELTHLSYTFFDTATKKLVRYNIPVDLTVDMPGEFGEATLSKAFLIAALDSEKPLEQGRELIENTIFKIFGSGVDYFILVSEENASKLDRFVNEGRVSWLLSRDTLIAPRQLMSTNMPVRKFYEIGTFMRSLPQDRQVVHDITSRDLDDASNIDEALRDMSLESVISQERASIAVLNGTDSPGFARFGSRVVQNAGGRVVAVNNSDTLYDESFVVAQDINSFTARYLAEVFGISKMVEKEMAFNFSEDEIERADIVIVLGLDTASALY